MRHRFGEFTKKHRPDYLHTPVCFMIMVWNQGIRWYEVVGLKPIQETQINCKPSE